MRAMPVVEFPAADGGRVIVDVPGEVAWELDPPPAEIGVREAGFAAS